MIKLIYERPEIHSPYSAVNKVEMTLGDEANLSEMLSAYREFLLSIGYTVPGELDVVEIDDVNDDWIGQDLESPIFPSVNRLEVIGPDKREYVRYFEDGGHMEYSLQDDDRTLKIFIKGEADAP